MAIDSRTRDEILHENENLRVELERLQLSQQVGSSGIHDILLSSPCVEMCGEVMQIVLGLMRSECGSFACLDEKRVLASSTVTRDLRDTGHEAGEFSQIPCSTWSESKDWCRSVMGKQSFFSNALSQAVDETFPVHRVLVAPILFHNQVIGYFEVANKAEDYDEHDRLKLEIIADSIAPVLHSRLQREKLEQQYKILESDLQKSREKLQAIYSSNFIGFICFDIHGNITFANNKFLDIVGYTRDDLNAGLVRWTDMTPPEFLDLSRKRIEEAISLGSYSPYEKQYFRKDGTRVWVLVGFVLTGELQDEGEAFVIDITDRKEAEEGAIENQRKISTLTGNLPGMVYRCQNDRDWAMEFVSEGCFQLTGYTSENLVCDKTVSYGEMICPEDRELVWNRIHHAVESRSPFELSYRIKTASGEIKWVWEKGVGVFSRENKLLALEGFISDVTEHKKLEMKLLHAQKMEAIGMLGGGIAHDFNNIINVIFGYANLLMETISEENRDSLEQILVAAGRAAGLTKSLLAFSRKQVMALNSIELNEVVNNIEKLLKIILREDIELRVSLSGHDLFVMADIGQIEQVLMNLTTNAMDAMPNGGFLTISTAQKEIDHSFIQSHGYGEIGSYALLVFSDTGCGMDDVSKQKIFEPFFTTKEVGKGTGLGLSMVYGIITQHNGFIQCHSELGKGTSFRIYLPISTVAQKQIEATTAVVPQKGAETILLAEDDKQLRDLTRSILERHGYSVILAENGDDAIARFRDDRNKIRLAILDVIMPKKNGKEVYGEIVQMKPGIKVLFMSGYAEDILDKNQIMADGLGFIAKPIHSMEFLRKIRNLLDDNKENSEREIF
jgi:PAS domain S-box-containing protein